MAAQPPVPPDDDEPVPGEVQLSADANEDEALEEDQNITLAGQANDPNRPRKKTKIRQQSGNQNTPSQNSPNLPVDTGGLSWERIGSYVMGALSDILGTIKRNTWDLAKSNKSKKDQKASSANQENTEAEENEALEEDEIEENADLELEAELENPKADAEAGADLGPRLGDAEDELNDLSNDGPAEANTSPPVVPAATHAAAKTAERDRGVSIVPEPTNQNAPRPNPRKGSTG